MSSEYSGINRIFKSDIIEKFKKSLHDGTFKDILSDWKWIMQFSAKYKAQIVIYTVIGILSSTMGLVSAYLSRTLINVVTQKDSNRILTMSIVYVVAVFVTIIMNNVSKRIYCKIGISVKNEIQKSIFEKIMDADWLSLSNYPNGDVVNRFDNDVETISSYAINWIPDLIVVSYSFITTFIVMFKMDRTMAFIALLSAPFMLVMSRFVVRKMSEYKKATKEMQSKMMAFAVETFYNTDTIKAFGIVKNSTQKLVEWQNKNKDVLLTSNLFEIKTSIASSFISFMVSAIAFGYCLSRLWLGKILFGDMTFFLSRRSNLTASFKSLIGMVPDIISSAVAAKRVRELIELPREIHEEESLNVLKKSSSDGLTVRMNNVSFSYDNEELVYQNGEFIAKPGEIIAVLGPSGEGKTTMIRLILGLVHPNEGSVTLECKDGTTREMNADLRTLFSYVPQGNTMMSGTVADNLRMIKQDATDEEIIEALKLSCAWEFVEKNSNGINMSVGEKGKGLSEGQAQRIAIARAVLNDAPVLLLDEATSALDEETERKVLENIITSKPNKTCIVSTHRKSVLKQCNRIYVIKNRQTEEYSSLEEYINSI